MIPRIAPLEAPFAPDVASMLEQMMPPDVPPIALFRIFARHLDMAAALASWGGYELSDKLTLSMRCREIVIDRVCARCNCEYEWGVHLAFFADRVGFSSAQVLSLTCGSAADDCWDEPAEQVLIEVVDALHDTATVGDELAARLAQYFDDQQQLDLFLLAGWYHAICFVANGVGILPEAGAPGFSDYCRDALD